jgi:HEPN domain-containing protein
VQDRYQENGTTYEYKSDYDILVVTEKFGDMPPGLAQKIRQKVKKAENLQTTPHLIFHDIGFVNKELEMGQYFFADIFREGTMLYDTGKFRLASPKELTPAERAEKAKIYFKEWFESANKFYVMYEDAFNREFYKEAIFILHQAAERYYMTIQLVFTDYKPKIHDLEKLNLKAGYLDARFKTAFPNHTAEEKRLFSVLVKAYIDSRYTLGYTVAVEDLNWLSERVRELRGLTEKICLEKIESFLS